MIDWFNHLYPYSNLHELNLDWVIATVKNGEKEIADFIGVNTIKYANPILWNIESQYEANTVVVDGQTGNAYISVKAVPSGVHINRTEYWTQIYNYANVVDTLREQIAHNEGDTTTTSQPFAVGDLVFVRTLLYRVIAPMIAGDSFVENSNIVKTTIEDELKANISAIQSEASARQFADTQLQSNINAESSARQSADAQLQSNINTEASARQNADTQLQSNIDAETSARQNADAQLQSNIDAEASARQSADAQLQSSIENMNIKIKNVLTIGDSFGDTVLHEQNPNDFGSWVLEFIGMTDYDNVYNYCKNSAGYYSTEERPYLTLAQEASVAINPLTIDLVIVQGGLNDVASGRTDGNTGTVDIDNTFDFIKQTFTNARVLIVPMTWSATFNGREPFLPSYQIWAMNIIKSAINHGFDIASTPWLWQIGHGDFVGSDNFHPNNAGAKNIAGHIKMNINGCDSVLYEHTEGTIAQNMYISWTLNGGSITMRGALMSVPWNGTSIIQPMPEELVPPKYGSMPQLFSAYTDVHGSLELVNAGYQLGVQPDGRGNLIFYGGALTSVASGTQINLYFEHSFTV